ARLGDGPFQLLQVGVEVEERVVPDRPPRLAQLLPVGRGAGRGGLPVAERGGRAAQVAAPPGVGQRRPRRGGEFRPCGRGRLGGPTGGGGSRPGSGRRHDGPVPARISARCTARTPLRSRRSSTEIERVVSRPRRTRNVPPGSRSSRYCHHISTNNATAPMAPTSIPIATSTRTTASRESSLSRSSAHETTSLCRPNHSATCSTTPNAAAPSAGVTNDTGAYLTQGRCSVDRTPS